MMGVANATSNAYSLLATVDSDFLRKAGTEDPNACECAGHLQLILKKQDKTNYII